MSSNAIRYDTEKKILGNPYRITRHHAPPQHPDPAPAVIRIDERRHRSYHLLFANAASLEDCIAILKRDWWPIS
jgi:hypothetical protein